MMEKIKRMWSLLLGIGMLIILVMALTGHFDDKVAQISGESDMLRGNDTGPTIANNTIETISDEPVSGSNNNVEVGTITETTDVVEEGTEQPSDSFDDMFNDMTSDGVEEPWWHEDRYYSLIDDSTNREINVRLHWALEDLGEIQVTLMEDGECVADTGTCVFETDAMRSYFTYNGEESSFYIDEDDGMDTLHLFLGDMEEIELPNLKWLQENAG